MKKLLSTLLALSLALSLGACAVKVEPDKPDEPAKDELRVVFTEEHLTKEVEYKADDGTVLLIEKYELRALLCEHVSAELADEWLATGRFVESDGALYAACADRGSDITIDTESYLVAWNGDAGEIMQTITRREWNDAAGNFVPIPGTETYSYPFTTVNGHAVFSAFPCPY